MKIKNRKSKKKTWCVFFNYPDECLELNLGSNVKVGCLYSHVQPYCTKYKSEVSDGD